MTGCTPVPVADFVDACGIPLHRSDDEPLQLDLSAAETYVWEMPGPMAYGVHEVLLLRGFDAPVARVEGMAGMVVLGAADAVPTTGQQMVIDRGQVRLHRSDEVTLPHRGSDDWYSRPRRSAPFGPVHVIVDAIRAATPIAVRRAVR